MSTAAMAYGYAPSVQPRLRLTQRGRAVLLTVAATPLVIAALVFSLNGGGASATLENSADFAYVTVEAGQSLWQLAVELAPESDPRDVIANLVQLNQLDSADVYAGQELAIPAQYSR